MVRISLSGDKELRAALDAMADDVRQEVSKAVIGTAIELRGDVVKSIQRGPKTGRVYDSIFRTINGKAVPVAPRSGNGLSATHQASAPGEAPASDTGRLASSITFDQAGPLTATVGSNLAYSVYLEFGTRKIAARPYFRPAVERMRPKFQQRLERALGIATR